MAATVPLTWFMIETVDPTTVTKGGTATVTVSFNNVWNGTDVVSIDPASVHIPDGTVVTFSSALGSFSPVAIPTVNGTATTTFTANTTVVGLINGTTDDQTVSVEINKLNTTVMVGNVTGVGGSSVNLTATLTDSNGNALSGKTVTFYVNGKSYTATTDSNGVAKVSFTVKEDAGTYPVTVSFPGDNTYLNCTSDGTSNLMFKIGKVFSADTLTEECAMCSLGPIMGEVADHPNVEVLNLSEVEEVTGHAGDFKVKIRSGPYMVNGNSSGSPTGSTN